MARLLASAARLLRLLSLPPHVMTEAPTPFKMAAGAFYETDPGRLG